MNRTCARSALLLLLSFFYFAAVDCKACEGENLPKDAPLRIGKKFKRRTCEKVAANRGR